MKSPIGVTDCTGTYIVLHIQITQVRLFVILYSFYVQIASIGISKKKPHLESHEYHYNYNPNP